MSTIEGHDASVAKREGRARTENFKSKTTLNVGSVLRVHVDFVRSTCYRICSKIDYNREKNGWEGGDYYFALTINYGYYN
jgi:hypothetical protein